VGIALPDAEKKNSVQYFLPSNQDEQKKNKISPSVCGGMHISTILNLHCFMRRLYEAPKLALNVVLRHTHIAKRVGCRVIGVCAILFRGMHLEPPPAEFPIACLKAGQRVFLAFVEAKIASSAEYTSRAKPLPAGHGRKRRLQAEHVKS
jgi:hypothetical protein